MKLPIAPESKSTLTECTLLVSVVLISIGRMMDILQALRVLAECHLDNLLFYFGFQSRAFLSGVKVRDASIGSMISVFISSMFNTKNLFTNSDQGTLFTGHAKQNSPLERSILFLLPLRLSEPLSLRSIPSSVPQLTFRCPSGEGSSSQDNWPLRITNGHLLGL